jgi:hypothetical protein
MLIGYVHVELHHLMEMNLRYILLIKYEFDEIIEKDYLYEQGFLMHLLIDKDIYQLWNHFL